VNFAGKAGAPPVLKGGRVYKKIIGFNRILK